MKRCMENDIQQYKDGKLLNPKEFINQFPKKYNKFHLKKGKLKIK